MSIHIEFDVSATVTQEITLNEKAAQYGVTYEKLEKMLEDNKIFTQIIDGNGLIIMDGAEIVTIGKVEIVESDGEYTHFYEKK